MNSLCAILITGFAAHATGSASQIQLPEADSVSTMITESSSLMQGEASVESKATALTSKIQDAMTRMSALKKSGAFLQKKMTQGVAMASSSNLLDASKVKSLHAVATDASMQSAVQEAIKTKATKRVTLEEVIVAEDAAQNTMDEASSELSKTYSELMLKYKQCQQCDSDCQQLKWHQYQVHTMAQCKQNCKINICKEVSPQSQAQEAAALEASMKVPQYAEPTKFSSYLQDYSKSGQEITVNDDDKFDIVWEQPSEQDATEESTTDPVEQLRASSMAQKSSEQVLKELHQQEEDRVKEASTEKLVKALA
eukprot:gnl/MRDRNA2_/MRDRNA2_96163_c0_seq1.p1 gnl/MRDRNA2_/MRDRNA2_96163_c0~~gnl/MRDRNA2_/MRDRNA2_96163_c0_seq1.p1  ORF type:complete len:334 (-),score=96.49 gnl/MRDRNA2_/MRDRNA2_96163_c0_seq1:26-955(-)